VENGGLLEGQAADSTLVQEKVGLGSLGVAIERLENSMSPPLPPHSCTPDERVDLEVPFLGDVEGDGLVSSKKVDNNIECSQTLKGGKRRNPTYSDNSQKRILRKDGKTDVVVSSQKKEVLRLLADLQPQKETGTARSKRSSSRK